MSSVAYLLLMGAMTVTVLVMALVAWLPRGASRVARRLDRLGAAVGLAVVPEVEVTLVRRSDRARRCRAVAGAVGWIAAACGCLLQSGWAVAPGDFWFPYVAFVVAVALGSGVAAIVDSRTRPAVVDSRVARLRAVTIDDYVPRRQLWMVSIGAVLALIGVWTALSAEGPVFGLIGLLVLVVLAVGLLHVGSRMIVARPQPASAPVELAWDDAIRSQNLYMLVYGSLTVCFYATLGAMVTVTQWATANRIGPSSFGPLVTTAIATTAAIVLMLAFGVSRRGWYYRDRLWPELATGTTPVSVDGGRVTAADGATL